MEYWSIGVMEYWKEEKTADKNQEQWDNGMVEKGRRQETEDPSGI